jgi:molecular chaperone GrpE
MSDEELHDDINLEPDEELGDISAAQAKIRKLRTELQEAQKKRDEYLDGWQRCKADAVNARKDTLAEADKRGARHKEILIEELIPVLDSFDMAAGSEAWAEISDGWKTGMENVRNQLLEVLSRHGVERFGRVGETFDPRMHEAVQEVDDTASERHSITKILRYGYRAGERVLRPAQVFVKK